MKNHAVVFFVLFCVTVFVSNAASLSEIKNQTTNGSFRCDIRKIDDTVSLDISMNLAPLALNPTLVKVVAEPSHTLLLAGVDETSAAHIAEIQKQPPISLVRGSRTVVESLNAHLNGITIPKSDNRIIVTYTSEETKTLLDITLSAFDTSGFAYEFDPQSEGCWVTGYCGDPTNNCGPVWCDPCVTYTLCCPKCTIHCGQILCP